MAFYDSTYTSGQSSSEQAPERDSFPVMGQTAHRAPSGNFRFQEAPEHDTLLPVLSSLDQVTPAKRKRDETIPFVTGNTPLSLVVRLIPRSRRPAPKYAKATTTGA